MFLPRGQAKERRRGPPARLAILLVESYPSKEPDEITAIRICHVWKRVVPERVFARARPVRLHAGILYVHTATSAWSSELEVYKERYVEAFRKHAPEANVRSVRFRVGPLPDLSAGTRPERPEPPPVHVPILPERLARTLASIDDDDLREAIGKAAGMALGRAAQRKR